MKFTVVTVCFNAEKTIEAAKRSLAAQHFRAFEWLVVDGASKDRTLEIVRSESNFDTRIILSLIHI